MHSTPIVPMPNNRCPGCRYCKPRNSYDRAAWLILSRAIIAILTMAVTYSSSSPWAGTITAYIAILTLCYILAVIENMGD